MIIKEFIVEKSKFKDDDQFYIGYIRNGHFKEINMNKLVRFFGIETLGHILNCDINRHHNYRLVGFIDVNKTNNICKELNLLLITGALKGNSFID